MYCGLTAYILPNHIAVNSQLPLLLHPSTFPGNVPLTTFPDILRSTSPTPIGRKPGFLLRGTSLLAINVSSDVVLL